MSYEKTWSFSLNVAPTIYSTVSERTRSLLYQLKGFLVGIAGWTVEASCNASSNGPSDLWTGVSAVVAGTEGASHSWVTLRSPQGFVAGANGSYTGDQSRYWLVLSANNGGGFGFNYVRFSFHRVSPTGGSNTATPTSADQISFDTQVGTSNVSLNTAHFACTDKGHFFVLTTEAGSNICRFALIVPPISSASTVNSTGYAYPYASPIICSYNTSGALLQANLTAGTGVQAWNADGSTSTRNARLLALGNGASGWIGVNFGSGGDSVNSEHPNGAVHAQAETLAKSAYLGKLADIFASGAPTPQSSVDNVSSPSYQYVGNLWLPCNAVMNM